MGFDPITAGLEFAGKVVDRIWPDATEQQKAEASARIAEIAHEENISSKEVEDRASARDREANISVAEAAPTLNKIITPILAISVVVLSFLLFGVTLFANSIIDQSNKDIAIYIMGALTTAIAQVLSYYFGSSSGSNQKSDYIHQLIKK